MKPSFLFAAAILFAVSGWASSEDPGAILKASAVSGTWILNGSVRAVRFDLKQNGAFEYCGYGSRSKGRWNVEGHHVRLRWTHVDSVAVDGQKVTALYSVEAGALKIGKFEYRKTPNVKL